MQNAGWQIDNSDQRICVIPTNGIRPKFYYYTVIITFVDEFKAGIALSIVTIVAVIAHKPSPSAGSTVVLASIISSSTTSTDSITPGRITTGGIPGGTFTGSTRTAVNQICDYQFFYLT